jgi:hypothetical protein
MALPAGADMSATVQPLANSPLQQPGSPESPTQNTSLIGPLPTRTRNLFALTGRPHNHLNLALWSLIDDDLGLLSLWEYVLRTQREGLGRSGLARLLLIPGSPP